MIKESLQTCLIFLKSWVLFHYKQNGQTWSFWVICFFSNALKHHCQNCRNTRKCIGSQIDLFERVCLRFLKSKVNWLVFWKLWKTYKITYFLGNELTIIEKKKWSRNKLIQHVNASESESELRFWMWNGSVPSSELEITILIYDDWSFITII